MTPEIAEQASILLNKLSELQRIYSNLESSISSGAQLARVELISPNGGVIFSELNTFISASESAVLLGAALSLINSKRDVVLSDLGSL